MGRNAAGESFLKGFLRYGTDTTVAAQIVHHDHRKVLDDIVSRLAPQKSVATFTQADLGALKQYGVSYYPGPGIGEHAWHRSFYGHGSWSLCGITHTTSSAQAMDSIAALLTSPVHPWDAVICTSQAVKRNVEYVLQAQVEFLKDRLAVSKLTLPALPVIPLGVHADEFVISASDRDQARVALGIEPDAVVVLYLGRLSFHAKAHPLAMYQALETALAKRTAKSPVVLIECGWHANDHIANAYRQAASFACPGVRVLTLDGRNPQVRAQAWNGSDIFCSLSDNIQETFGITPIEAMAAGMPVVVSDWDGYKDTVRDGEDGFRVPTLMPPAGLGGDFASRHALGIDTYDMYCGYTSSLVAVDIAACANALATLMDDPEHRARMGKAAQERVRSHFDWSAVIPQYEALWAELNNRRTSACAAEPRLHQPAIWPARLDPFISFGHYATHTLTPQTRVRPVQERLSDSLERLDQLVALTMVNYTQSLLISTVEAQAVLGQAHSGAQFIEEILQSIAPARRPYVFRAIGWLLKIGLLERIQ